MWVTEGAATGMSCVMHEFCEQLSAALRREDGQGATEYGLVIAVILLSLALTVVTLASSITTFLDGVAGLVDLLVP